MYESEDNCRGCNSCACLYSSSDLCFVDVALGTCESSVADPRVLLLIFIIIQSEEETLVISLSACLLVVHMGHVTSCVLCCFDVRRVSELFSSIKRLCSLS